ncbi:hypothetical protein J0Y14_003873 [Salmonella enterica]|nr:hypothetical protein [Salmonella enterica]
MACNCFKNIKERMDARLREAVASNCSEVDESDFDNRVFILEKMISATSCCLTVFVITAVRKTVNLSSAVPTPIPESQSITARSVALNSMVKSSQPRNLPHEIRFYGNG